MIATGGVYAARFAAQLHLAYTMQSEDLFRSANDAIAEKGRESGWTLPGPFLCECSDLHCLARVELTLEAYKELRSHSGRYVLANGHQVADATEIRRTDGYTLVEKFPRAARSA